MEMQEKSQADFDLEKMFEMLDEALTSKDERVQSALRALLTIITLTRTQDDGSMAVERSYGPLRQIQEDFNNIVRRLHNVESELRQQKYQPVGAGQPWNPYGGQGVAGQPWTNTGYPPPGPFYTSTDTNTNAIGGVATQSPQLWNQK